MIYGIKNLFDVGNAKRIAAFIIALVMIFCFTGCNQAEPQESSSEVVVIEQQTIIVEDDTMSNESIVSSEITQQNSSVDTPASSDESVSSQVSSVESTPSTDNTSSESTINIDYEWKSHSEDYKLLAFTFDDGPSDLMQDYITLFAAFDGAGTFFVNGRKFRGEHEYYLAQNAINHGWDIGNHGDQHLVATIGGANGGEVSYDELRADIDNLTHKLETNLKKRDGSPYEVAIYRPPNIQPTANTFKICAEENFPVIWLAYDAYDWDTTKTDKYREDVFKNGIGKWEDGDIILCHEVQEFADQTYAYLEKYLADFYRQGYRFCSITELMELRGITREQISGELSGDNNRGMVTNIIKAAELGKK